jgi:hypothetical protein
MGVCSSKSGSADVSNKDEWHSLGSVVTDFQVAAEGTYSKGVSIVRGEVRYSNPAPGRWDLVVWHEIVGDGFGLAAALDY